MEEEPRASSSSQQEGKGETQDPWKFAEPHLQHTQSSNYVAEPREGLVAAQGHPTVWRQGQNRKQLPSCSLWLLPPQAGERTPRP